MPTAYVPPDILTIAREYLITEFGFRGGDYADFTFHLLDIPATRPENPFIVIEQLNVRQDTIFAVDVLTQFRVYDRDGRRGKNAAWLVNGLVPQMPNGLEVNWAEHAGGPTELPDPDVPGLSYWAVTWWITALCVAV